MILFLKQTDLSLGNGFIVHQNCWFLLWTNDSKFTNVYMCHSASMS